MDPLTWNLRLRSTGRDRATAYVRQQRFDIGVPLQFDSEYDQVTALEYVLAALAADLVNGFAIRARRRRLRVDDLEATVSGVLNNPLTYLGVIGEDGHPGLERVTVRVYVTGEDDEEQLRQIWEETLSASPLVHTLRLAMTVDLHLTIFP